MAVQTILNVLSMAMVLLLGRSSLGAFACLWRDVNEADGLLFVTACGGGVRECSRRQSQSSRT